MTRGSVSFTLIALLLVCVDSQAGTKGAAWFQSCERLAGRSLLLREFLETQMPVQLCFMLNSKELLYIDNATGTNFQGLYYQNLGAANQEPARLTGGTTSVPKEFVVASGKRYAVIESGSMNHGMESGQTHLLYLMPRSSDGVFKVARIAESYNNEACVDPKQPGSCEKPEYGLLVGDGMGREIQITSARPMPALVGPKFQIVNGAVDALEFELRPVQGNPQPPYKYVIQLAGGVVKPANFQGLVNAIRHRSFNPTVENLSPRLKKK
jgi:hypothetical protein